MDSASLDVRIVSSLEKILPGKAFSAPDLNSLSLLRGERANFQIVCRSTEPRTVRLRATGGWARFLRVRTVGFTWCESPADPADPFVIAHGPGWYPLALADADTLELAPGEWQAFWVTLSAPAEHLPSAPPHVDFLIESDGAARPLTLPLDLADAVLPPQHLRCEMWFHTDCLLHFYRLEPWTEDAWRLLAVWFRNMAEHGLNTLLTPLWTPPLDTAPGGERPTVQLLRIAFENGRYTFDFSRLERWIETARAAGIEYFSFSHLFTQWGLAATPKIMVSVDGADVRRFGWDVSADSPEYARFLAALFAALLPFLRAHGLGPDRARFHLSDEPAVKDLENYRRCSMLVHSLLEDYLTLDALSELEFYDLGLVDIPVPGTTAVESFLARTIPERWTYYCSDWVGDLPNRKLSMPSLRNRVLGVILFMTHMDGFLEWGYNFWFSQYSRNQDLNPFDRNDFNEIFGGNGGAFAVMPGPAGKPTDTLHYEVFSEALSDLRALEALKAKIGGPAAEALVNEGLPSPVSFHVYPHDSAWLLDLRRRVNRALK